MSANGTQAPFKYFDGVSATTPGKAIRLHSDAINGYSFHNDWNAGIVGTTLAGTLQFFHSNDPRADENHPDNADAVWVEITSSLTITEVTTGAGNAMQIINNLRGGWVRMDITVSGGTGDLTTWGCSHGTG